MNPFGSVAELLWGFWFRHRRVQRRPLVIGERCSLASLARHADGLPLMAALARAGIDAEVVADERRTVAERSYNFGRPSALRLDGPWNLFVPTVRYEQARDVLLAARLVPADRIDPLPEWIPPSD